MMGDRPDCLRDREGPVGGAKTGGDSSSGQGTAQAKALRQERVWLMQERKRGGVGGGGEWEVGRVGHAGLGESVGRHLGGLKLGFK